MHRALAIATFLCALGTPGAAQEALTVYLDEPVVEVPMNLSTRHLALEVFVGDEGPFPFNLDTYAVTTACVDRRFAERMGFEKVDVVTNGDGSGATRELDVVWIPELRLGGAVFMNVRALVDDYSWVDAPGGGAVDGLLGYHLFQSLLLELDYPGRRVVLRRGELEANDEHVVTHLALRRTPDIPLRIGNRQFLAGIDSGAQSALSLPGSWMESVELAAPAIVAGRAKTVYSEAEIFGAELADPLVVAGHERRAQQVAFSELFGKPLIGHDMLVDYSVTFDQANGRVRFRPAESIQPRK